MAEFLKGMKVVHRAQSAWGVGHVLAVSDDPPRLSAQFPGRPGGPVMLSSRDAALARFRFAPETPALLADGTPARVLRVLPGPAQDLYRYTVEAEGKKPSIRSEADLRAPAPREGPAEQLASGRWGAPEDFALRGEAVRLDLLRRADALGALFASRVYVKPHQVSVAHQVLSAPQPRFVLADEVGLGKTIEAGLVLSALLHAGLVKRCLVVAPSHLTVQWLAELFHKFNLLFTLMDPDRAREDREAAEAEADESEGSPWSRHPLVITSLEFLSRSKEEAAAAAEAGWDLVVIDEAHHLRGARAYEVAQALAKRTWGLLLLTATPLQLDPAEYHALLRLVDPAPAATEAELRARLARQGALSAEVRALLLGDKAAAERIAKLFPDDPELAKLRGPPLLAHLAESYGLSARLLRNRRAVVGGFTPRTLTKIDVQLSREEQALEAEVREALGQAKLPSGAVLASLFRRLGSSPPSLAAGLAAAGEKKLAQRALSLPRDSKLEAFHQLLQELGQEKVLVFAETRETVEYLRAALAKKRIEALAYLGDLSPAERDKLVARFRDPDGPRGLLSTELGGEGRNFQHCHVLVNYDLAWSPAAIEQRLGRIDRIGQSREVRIYAFAPEGTLAARVLEVLDAGVSVFTEPTGGLDPVLESVESELLALASSNDPKQWSRKTAEIAARVSAARAEVARAYDPLLDLRSCDLAAVRALAERGGQRLGARIGAGGAGSPRDGRARPGAGERRVGAARARFQQRPEAMVAPSRRTAPCWGPSGARWRCGTRSTIPSPPGTRWWRRSSAGCATASWGARRWRGPRCAACRERRWMRAISSRCRRPRMWRRERVSPRGGRRGTWRRCRCAWRCGSTAGAAPGPRTRSPRSSTRRSWSRCRRPTAVRPPRSCRRSSWDCVLPRRRRASGCRS